MNKTKSTKNMLHLALALMAIVLIGACGGSGGSTGGAVEITCMDVNYTAEETCNAIPEAQNKPQRAAAGALAPMTYDAGIIDIGVNIWAQAEITNKSVTTAQVYFYTEFNKDGVFNNNTAQTYKIECAAGDMVNAQYGSNPCPDPGPCSQDGYWEYVTYIYNASHLAEDELGDPAIDEPLAVGTLKFTLEPAP